MVVVVVEPRVHRKEWVANSTGKSEYYTVFNRAMIKKSCMKQNNAIAINIHTLVAIYIASSVHVYPWCYCNMYPCLVEQPAAAAAG